MVTPHFRPSLRDFPGKIGASWRPSSELLGYYHMSLRDKNVGNDKGCWPRLF